MNINLWEEKFFLFYLKVLNAANAVESNDKKRGKKKRLCLVDSLKRKINIKVILEIINESPFAAFYE